ncbi:WYL domain-containing protein [uncultured Cetobacterium sp.]|uniref:WYL domain-containing protein n=1 Tax=uncultured Cetobacterium sp. TaxID=527638 RepID=UPI0026102CDE|nr:WYL domain-containing protein [uncultured Cetobacterium sp.]
MEKKIRITLSKKILEILESDMDEFLIKKNTLLNLIYEKLKTEFSRVKINSDGDTQVIQFNLNKRNKENYYFFLEENNIQNESEFFRDIITYYALMRKKEREAFLFEREVELLKIGIKERRVEKIIFNDKNEVEIEPYYLGCSKLELANYIFCYNIKENSWKNYKLKYINNIYLTKENFKVRDKKFIESVKKEFGPFLSKGKIVKVRLSNSGEKLFKEIRVNRPKLLEKIDSIYVLECSEEKAKRYFSYFLDDAEILEPISLRSWFEKRLEKALNKYKKIPLT